MNNLITDLLRIEFPLMQAGLPGMAGYEMASAVSGAGGLGVIGSEGMTTDQLSQEIAMVREMTDRPFGVHVNLKDEGVEELAQVVAAAQVPVVICEGGNPAGCISVWKDYGAVVMAVVNNDSMVGMMEKAGVEAVIAAGVESMKPTGFETTMAALPRIVDTAKVPVIAAGGIEEGRGMVASFMMGAQGVMMDTRFAASTESRAHDDYKKKLVAGKNSDSELMGFYSGHPVRMLKNGFSREYLKKEKEGTSPAELDKMVSDAYRKAVVDGDVIHGLLAAGAAVGLVREVRSASEIVHEILEETQWLMSNGLQRG